MAAYTEAITGSYSNIDKKINDFLENEEYSQVLDIKLVEITKTSTTFDLLALLILEA